MVFVTSLLTLMFLEALLFVLAYPDPGCDGFEDKETCIGEDSVYDQSKPACLWDSESQSCSFNEPDAQILLLLVISMMAIVFATPLDVLIPYIIESVLSKKPH